MDTLSSFIDPWRQQLSQSRNNLQELPGYSAQGQIDSLITTSCPQSFELGTGASIYTNSLLPAILQAKYEVILVTCFWAPSATLTALRDTLEELAEHRKQRIQENGPDADISQPLRIRICFSSCSLLQKLFHTSSRDGRIYSPEAWQSQLGLPHPDILKAGAIDLQVKSLFFLPFSVMHPKFLIVDRQRAWFPSCNVSWESWLEGCVEITGNAVAGLMTFYRTVWEKDLDLSRLNSENNRIPDQTFSTVGIASVGLASTQSPARRFARIKGEATPTILLPSSHHRNPCYRLLPWSKDPTPPTTPLNSAILQLLEMAEDSIYMQTPNLTSAAVMDGIIKALQRGVEVTIVTSKGMMLLEQIVTAGTTTSLCLRSLINRYKKLVESVRSTGSAEAMIDLEPGPSKLGHLSIWYFQPDSDNQAKGVAEEPVHSHLKLTIVDGKYTVLGSGNMDRASWFTSQELGILFHSVEFARTVRETVSDGLKGRIVTVFDPQRGT